MKIILDVDCLTPPITGIGRYTQSLVRGLCKNSRIDDVKFYASGRWITNTEDLLSEISFRSTIRQKIPLRRLVRQGYKYFNNSIFYYKTNRYSDYIYHAPNYKLMPFAGRSVVTIHDLSFMRHPEYHRTESAAYWNKEIHRVVNEANHIITDSEFQKREIIELLNIPHNKVTSVHLGVEAKFQKYSEISCSSTLEKYNLDYKKYSLVVATKEPRKNFMRLLKAFQKLPQNMRNSFPLAIVGSGGWLSDDVHKEILRLVEKNQAINLGYVGENDLIKLYSAASLFLYPSLYEGFGLPVLEAMASGTAVLSSNQTSMSEIAGNNCLLVNPYSIDEISKGWTNLLESEVLREDLSRRSYEHSRTFTWDRCIDQTIDVYKLLG